VGAGIQLGPNATRILERWGVSLPSSVCEPEGLELRSARTGALLNTIPLGETVRTRYGAPYLTMLRADLQSALLRRAGDVSCSIQFGNPVAEARDEGKRTIIETAKGSVEASALIGADGLHSTVRDFSRLAAQPVSANAIAWRALLSPGAVPAPLRSIIAVWMGSGAHLVHYPVSGGSALNAVLIIDQHNWPGAPAPLAESSQLPALLRRIRDWPDLPSAAITSIDDWRPWAIYRSPKSRGGAGRIQLIGDAWHAMPPFLASGGVLAIEDGAALASSLAESHGAIVQGFEIFRAQRARRVWRTASASARMGRIYHMPRPFDAVRDAAIKAMPASRLLSANDWLYSAGK
jgi:salicylate hydroxylase